MPVLICIHQVNPNCVAAGQRSDEPKGWPVANQPAMADDKVKFTNLLTNLRFTPNR